MPTKIGRFSNGVGHIASNHYAECVMNCHVGDAGVYTVIPDRYTVFCCGVHKGKGSCSKSSCTGTLSSTVTQGVSGMQSTCPVSHPGILVSG